MEIRTIFTHNYVNLRIWSKCAAGAHILQQVKRYKTAGLAPQKGRLPAEFFLRQVCIYF
jgi:hypothetical protein